MNSDAIPENWRDVAVEDIKAETSNALSTGPFGSSIGSRFFQNSGVPVIRGSNLSQDIGERLVPKDLVFLSEEKALEFERSKVKLGDLIFTCWGTIDQVGLVDKRSPYPEYIISNKQMKLTPNPDRADSLFLYYLFSSPEMTERIRNQGIGSSVPGFNLGQLRSMRIRLPSLPEQRAIARILGSLDDKIELNRSMNGTLEAMAQAIFKSWFVDFDPVRSKAEGREPEGMDAETAALFPDSFEETELGMVPNGWRAGTIEQEFNLTMGQSPPGDTYNEAKEGVPFFQGRTDFGNRYPSVRMYCNAPTRMANKSDTLISVRAPVGDINMALVGCCIGRGLSAVRHKTGSRSFTYYMMHSLKETFTQFEAEGTVFGSINKKDFQEIICISAQPEVVKKFENIVFPLDQMIEKNEIESRLIAAIRDALLPKLLCDGIRFSSRRRCERSRHDK